MHTFELPTDNPRFAPSGRASLKLPAEDVRVQMMRLAQNPEIPKPIINGLLATTWFLTVQAFRTQEDDFLVAGTFTSSLDDHRAMLADIIADGEQIVFSILHLGLDKNAPFSVEELQATLQSLHATFYCEHGPKNSPQINNLIEGLFDVAKP